MRNPLVVAAILLGACDGTGSLVGDDVGVLAAGDDFELAPDSEGDRDPGDDGDSLQDLPDGYQGAFFATCLDGSYLPGEPVMTAFADSGSIFVVHEGIVTSTDPGWVIRGRVSPDQGVIEMWYEETNTPQSMDSCEWYLEYTIYGVPAGTWTVRARGDEVTVDVLE